jgi:pyrroloquinoline quinone biosynthesis protein B
MTLMPFLVLAATLAVSATSGEDARDEAGDRVVTKPFLRVIGSAQDAGLPHAGCQCDRCDAARTDPARRRLVASLALVLPTDPLSDRSEPLVLLVDATPDVREQLDRLDDVRDEPDDRADRDPVDGILLTHAHMGHYLGLAFFGFESLSTKGITTYCTKRMGNFLRENGPWSQLVSLGNITIAEIAPGEPFELGAGVRVTPHAVPHRDEYSDTVGFLFQGPRSTVLYVPDTEPWRTWNPSLPEYLDSVDGGVDVLLVDGSFFDPGELPGRHVASIGHPLITDTMDLLQDRVAAGTLAVYFTHLNHSNPAIEPDSDARREIEQRGFHVVDESAEFDL